MAETATATASHSKVLTEDHKDVIAALKTTGDIPSGAVVAAYGNLADPEDRAAFMEDLEAEDNATRARVKEERKAARENRRKAA